MQVTYFRDLVKLTAVCTVQCVKPVMRASSAIDVPSTTFPSTGTLLPGLTRIQSPRWTNSTSIRFSSSIVFLSAEKVTRTASVA